MKEAEIAELLRSRIGRATRIIATDGEPMEVREVVDATHPAPLPYEYAHYVENGGIPLSADYGRYFFYSSEVGRIEDVETGEVIFTRDAS